MKIASHVKGHNPKCTMRVWAIVLLLLVTTLSGWSAANAIRRSSSFVAPTQGSAHALTLTTYVTDAADLHYATVQSSHLPLDAVAIKNAALQFATTAKTFDGIVQANTVAVHRAQKLERLLDGLQPNASYDVYFVAEVPNSNGVFGAVLSVLGTITNPQPPHIVAADPVAANASATSVMVGLTLASPGLVHLALIPSNQDAIDRLTADDVVARRNQGLNVVFAMENRFRWDLLSVQTRIGDLTPATEFDMLVVTEATGHGGVFSELHRQQRAVQTHVSAPDVVDLACAAANGNASSVDISFRLAYVSEDLQRVTFETLPRYRFDVKYELSHGTANGTMNIARRGSFSIGAFEKVKDLVRDTVDNTLHHSIGDLDAGMQFDATLYVETTNSYGVIGKSQKVEKCQTHMNAPDIIGAEVQPVDGTVDALQVDVRLERPGNVHYVLAPLGASMELRNSLLQMKSITELVQSLRDAMNRPQYRSGVIEMDEDESGTPTTKSFLIEGLKENTSYSIAVIPETIGSFGVMGKSFQTLLEATTNEKASETSLIAVQPTHGSTTSIDVRVNMVKPLDILFACWKTYQNEEICAEVSRDKRQQTHQSLEGHEFLHRIGNLSEDTRYEVAVFAESHMRNGVRSERTVSSSVKTSRPAPQILTLQLQAVDARVDAVRLVVEVSEPGIVHFVITEGQIDDTHTDVDNEGPLPPLPVEMIIDEPDQGQQNAQLDSHRHTNHAAPHSNLHHVVKRGHAFAADKQMIVIVDQLRSNTSYVVHVVTETCNDNEIGSAGASGVYGTPKHANTSTHDVAPVIVKATVHPTSNRTDSIEVSVNVSRPGIVHYALTDIDFADPVSIRGRLIDPHVLRGSFVITAADMGMEIKNGTNDTQPMNPLVFATNYTIDNLHEGTTYHLSLTTETAGSTGVFGGFPAPILVTTHESSPKIDPETLFIGPIAATSSQLSIKFQLDKFGDVHYAVFFRGIAPDLTTEAAEELEQRRLEEQEIAAEAHAKLNEMRNSTDKVKEFVKIPRWPPPTSTYDLSHLTPRAVKEAAVKELGEGVWENGTVSVSRDDVFKRKVTEKKIEKLPANAIFDICLAPETAASDGIFASLTCQRVTTHADYSNQSIAYDEISVKPVLGSQDAVRVELFISKLMGASHEGKLEVEDTLRHLERVAGRVPYFILIDGHEGRPHLSQNAFGSSAQSHRHDRTTSPFKTAVPGRGNVVATGVLDRIIFENESFVAVEHIVTGLNDNHRYFFFFAYETAHSDGVFTKVNPHKNRSNETDSRTGDDHAIEVITFEQAPRVKRYEATPTYGDTHSIIVNMDVVCASSEELILHVLVVNDGCQSPSIQSLLGRETELKTVEMNELHQLGQCDFPLLYRRVQVNTTERSNDIHHQRHNHHQQRTNDGKVSEIQEVIASEGVLMPNTTYQVMIATETSGSGGVMSDKFTVVSVTTHPTAPRFNQLKVTPRKGSTTELMMIVELEHPGEVHYMIGKSGNAELKVTSPYNVSAKSLPGQRDSKFHDYGRDVVRLRRSIKLERARQTHVEIIDYLVAGTSYDVFVVAETADDSGIYGEVLSFSSVSTFATPPMLLAHTAYPTPGSTDSLSVGFRVEEGIPCLVHISIITSKMWDLTSHVATGSDTYGNRLAMEDRFIGNSSIHIDDDKEWHEINMSVSLPGTNYTVFLVSETRDSDGVFGTVAAHHGVRSHREPPVVVNVIVRAADARVDALTVDLEVNHDEGAHIHYAVLRHRQRFSRSAIATIGRINVNGTNATSFLIEGLHGRTTYDVYVRLETFESGGVVGEWSAFPITATTHGLPAEVLESVECTVVPSCDTIGRHPCSHVANVCGDCLDGFDGITGSSNEACHPLASGQLGPTIKISGVRINPRRRRHQLQEPHDVVSEPIEPSPYSKETQNDLEFLNGVSFYENPLLTMTLHS